MAYQFITMQRTGKVLTILLNRPPTNPLSGAFARELFDAFTEVDRMEDVTVVVVASALEKAFVAGADIKEMASMDRAASEAFSKLLQDANDLLPRMRKVVVAAINGHALGGGCELAMARMRQDINCLAPGDRRDLALRVPTPHPPLRRHTDYSPGCKRAHKRGVHLAGERTEKDDARCAPFLWQVFHP